MIKKDDLLGLVVEVGEISLESAARKLGADEKQVLDIAYELEKEGWIEKVDRELNNPHLIPKKEAFKRMHVIAESVIKRSAREAKETKDEKDKVKNRMKNNLLALKKSIKKNALDLIFIASIIVSLYMFDSFLRDINENTGYFVIGVLSFSLAIVVYMVYKSQLKVHRAVVLLMPFVREEESEIMKVISFVLSIAFFGRFILSPSHQIYNLLLGSIFLSMMLVQYQEHLKASKKMRIVVGLTLMIISIALILKFFILLLLGGFSFENLQIIKYDIIFGVLIWLFVKNQRNYFCIGPKTIEFMIRDVAQERPEDRSERFY
ncbi:MAG: hypothetical protein MSIBF_05790 [Candidatus Altiarchaeales archaeon IMC4]|nr:MAG: hypothetical protein MSIBF_05790 [Candidatus Altiarchaeales archaeon IMC4]